MPAPTVFLSSTFADFELERARLEEVLPIMGIHVVSAYRQGYTGKNLVDMLRDLIDQADMVVLLIGSRAGSACDTGEHWTKLEVDYALARGKMLFAYRRELPPELEVLTDSNREGQIAIQSLLAVVQEAKRALIPRFKREECCRLTAMVIRDVTRHVQDLAAEAAERASRSYDESFA